MAFRRKTDPYCIVGGLFPSFGTTDESSTGDNELFFGIGTALWPKASKENGVSWYDGRVGQAERFMATWHGKKKGATSKENE